MHIRFPARVLIGALIIAAAMASIAGFARWQSSGSAATHPLAWSDCGDDFDCARLDVPIDYDHPGGKKISLALTRLPAADPPHRIGVLLVNPGGPGESGIAFAHGAATAFPPDVRAQFDIIGFDPRGVGRSAPVLCSDNTTSPTPVVTQTPDNRPARDRALSRLTAHGESCREGTGDVLPFVDTVSSARDIERIRNALGEESISYFGYSYGTLLGATYADLYPAHVRAFVLDGAIDPALDYEATLLTALAEETALKSFFADCESHPDCPHYNGGNTEQHFEILGKSLDAAPLTDSSGVVLRISRFTLNALQTSLCHRAPGGRGSRGHSPTPSFDVTGRAWLIYYADLVIPTVQSGRTLAMPGRRSTA